MEISHRCLPQRLVRKDPLKSSCISVAGSRWGDTGAGGEWNRGTQPGGTGERSGRNSVQAEMLPNHNGEGPRSLGAGSPTGPFMGTGQRGRK